MVFSKIFKNIQYFNMHPDYFQNSQLINDYKYFLAQYELETTAYFI